MLIRAPRRLLLAVPALALVLTGCASSGGADAGSDNPVVTPPTSEVTSASAGGSSTAASAAPSSCSYPADGNMQPDGTPSTTTLLAPKTLTLHLRIGAEQKKVNLPIATAATAPCTVNALAYLASKGYFDGTKCHRLTTAGIFVLQCGDPTGTGAGTPGFSYADELSGSETYGAGTIAMANAGANTDGSQFFVVYADSPLSAKYTVWGHIDATGVAAISAVAAAGTSTGASDGAPKSPVTIESVSAS